MVLGHVLRLPKPKPVTQFRTYSHQNEFFASTYSLPNATRP